MMRRFASTKAYACFILISLLAVQAYAQPLTGTKTVGAGGNYTTLASAIAALNTNGAGSGGVTFQVAAGHTETFSSPTAGTITTTTGSATSPIVFRKSGAGNNPLITAGVGTGTTTDGIIKIAGTDYITFDGIDLQEASGNTTATTQMEWGYAILKASATDGSQHVTISNCSITLQKSNTNTKGIYSGNHTATSTSSLTVSTAAGTNSYLDIFSNKLTNVFSGIYCSGYSNATYYDDSLRIGSSGQNVITNFGGSSTAYGIYVHYFKNADIRNDSIYNNFTPTTSSTYYGIYTGNASNANARIVNNAIQIILNGSQSTRAAYGINCNNGTSGNQVVIDSNRIQNFIIAASSTNLQAIYVSSTADTYISNNVVSGFVRTGTSGKCYFINCDLAPAVRNIYNNVVSTNDVTGTSSQSAGIRIEAGGGNVYGNRIVANTNSGTSAQMWAIYVEGAANIYNNQVGGNTGSASSNEFFNIFVEAGNANIYGNEVYGSSTAGSDLVGIELAGTGGVVYNVYRNKIYGFTSSSNTCVVSGIRQSALSTATIYNNVIGVLSSGSSTTTTNGINGINITSSSSGTVSNIYHNTVYLNATSTGGTNCLYLSVTPAATVINNIFVNLSAVGSNANRGACAIKRSGTTYTTYQSASDNNLLYVSATPVNYKYLYYDGSNAFQSLAAYQAYAVTPEQSSISAAMTFANTSGLSPDFLKPMDTAYTESAGKIIAGITGDFLSDVSRATYPQSGQLNGGGSAPDIGAHELDLLLVDKRGPSITMNALTKVLANPFKVLDSVSISDPSGVNTSSGTAPRLYFKKSTDANALAAANNSSADGWKYVESYNSASPFSFFIDYSLLYATGAVSGGDVIQYFIVAQDLAATPNVGVRGATFASAPASVSLGAAQFPATGLSSFNVLASGIPAYVTVGASGADYTSFTQSNGLFAAINNGIVTNDVTVNVISDLSAENGAVTLGRFSEEGVGAGTYRISIRPNAGSNYTVSGSCTSGGLFRIQDAARITFDGSFSNTGRFLTFINKAVSGTVTVFHIAGTTAGGGCNDVNISNCNIWTDTSLSMTNNGIFIGGTTVGNGSGAALGYNNRLIRISNNAISHVYNGILVNGISANPADSVYLIGNEIGSDSTSKYIGTNGIYLKGIKRSVVSGNRIFNMINALSNDMTGINCDQDVTYIDIAGNRISEIVNTASASVAVMGIASRNTTNNNLLIRNNTITRILGQGAAATIATGPLGIYLNNGDNSKILNNAVTLSGNRLDLSTGNAYTACLYVKNGIVGLNISNNVFKNVMTSSNSVSAGNNFAVFTNSSNTNAFTRLDNNLYYVNSVTPGMVNALGYIGSAARSTLSAWRSYTGFDMHSLWGEPGYLADSLAVPNLNDTNLWHTNGRAYPFAEVSSDISGNSRSTTLASGAADIGAWEVTPNVPPRKAAASALPAAGTTTHYTVAGDTVASISWAVGNPVPADIAVQYFSGTNPPALSSPYYMHAYWDVQATAAPGFSYDMTLWYKPEAMRNITESNLVMAQRSGASWLPYTSGSTVVNMITDKMTVAGLSTFSPFTGTDASNPLPVKWLSFTGRAQRADAVLEWYTAAEMHTDYFAVERSSDGLNFTPAGSVSASGTSSSVSGYSYTDAGVLNDKRAVYYRIVPHHHDGHADAASAVVVINPAAADVVPVQAFPNPFREQLHLQASEDVMLYLHDGTGRIVFTGTAVKGATTIDLLATLPAGIYVLRSSSGTMQKLVKEDQ